MRKLYSLLLAAGLLSCSTSPTEQPATATRAAAAKLATAPEQAVKAYLNWYATHHEEFNPNFIEGGGEDTTSFYAVDQTVAEDWLTRLHQSGHFSTAYVQRWRSYIQSYADTLQKHPQNDGPPEGFSYDLLMLSQEPDTRLTELQKGTFSTRYAGPTSATVRARGTQHEGWREGLDFALTKNTSGKWLIDSINVPDDLVQ
jgi:hypothetical protein